MRFLTFPNINILSIIGLVYTRRISCADLATCTEICRKWDSVYVLLHKIQMQGTNASSGLL